MKAASVLESNVDRADNHLVWNSGNKGRREAIFKQF